MDIIKARLLTNGGYGDALDCIVGKVVTGNLLEGTGGLDVLHEELIRVGARPSSVNKYTDTGLYFFKEEFEEITPVAQAPKKLPFLELTPIEDVELEEGFVYTAKLKITDGKDSWFAQELIKFEEGRVSLYTEGAEATVWIPLSEREEVFSLGKLCTHDDH